MRYAILLLAIGMLAVPAFAVDADESEEYSGLTCRAEDMAKAGAVPGDFTYGFKRFFEGVDRVFTFGDAGQARKNSEYGLLRAVEAHTMACKAKTMAAEGDQNGAEWAAEQSRQLVQEQERDMERARERLGAALDDGTADERDVQEVGRRNRNSIIVLQGVYEKVPEQAREGILRALNNSIGNYERHMEMVQKRMPSAGKPDGVPFGPGKPDDAGNRSRNVSADRSEEIPAGRPDDAGDGPQNVSAGRPEEVPAGPGRPGAGNGQDAEESDE